MSAGAGLLSLVAIILGLGVVTQVLADRLEIPSVLFLILAGIGVGPEGLDLIGLESFGGVETLSAIVGLSVAIIVFEGAFHLKLSKLRQTPHAAFRLGTLGTGLSLVGTAVVVRFALDVSWGLSFLVGSLLIATGPTVITPILEVVPVRDRVAAALETEGIVNDVTAALLAVAVFDAALGRETALGALVESFVSRLGIGILVGIVIAAVLWYFLKHIDLSTSNAVRNSRLIVLVGAIVTYGIAGELAAEAGIAAAATAGVLLGNPPLRGGDRGVQRRHHAGRPLVCIHLARDAAVVRRPPLARVRRNTRRRRRDGDPTDHGTALYVRQPVLVPRVPVHGRGRSTRDHPLQA